MSWSLNEVEAMARKAAKGAGLSWGLAEDAGRAVVWLEARGLEGAAALARYLNAGLSEAPKELGSVWKAPAGLCPIQAGAYLADCGNIGESLSLEDVSEPLLLAFFCAEVGAGQLVWDGGMLEFSQEGEAFFSGDKPAETADVRLQAQGLGGGKRLAKASRSNARCEDMRALEAFAARTYAPATEASRLAGAGAGTSDND